MQRRRVRYLLLDHVVLELRRGERQATGGGDRAPLDGVLPGRDQGQHLVVVMEVGELEPGRPAHGVQCLVQRDAQLLGQGGHLGPGRCPVEAAHPDVDRMDRPAADQLHDRVAGLLQRQPPLDQVAAVFGEGERAGVAEEVGGMQQVDVQGVALDPLAAVEQAAKIGGWGCCTGLGRPFISVIR